MSRRRTRQIQVLQGGAGLHIRGQVWRACVRYIVAYDLC